MTEHLLIERVAKNQAIDRRSAILGGSLLLLASTGGARARIKGSAIQKSPALENQLLDLLRAYAPEQLPGVTASVGMQGGETWNGSAGYLDLIKRIPLEEADAIGIGSITKTFVAVVTLQLMEAGRIDLQATVTEALGPELTDGIANSDSATLAQLMSHTSGIISWEDNPRWIHDGRGDRIDPTRKWANSGALDYIRGQPALFQPGEKYSYSNTNYTLLGLVIERVTGAQLASEIEKRICSRLGLRHTFLEGFSDPETATRRSHRYHYATPGFAQAAGISPYFHDVGDGLLDVSATNLSTEWAAGGIVSTAADVVRFFSALRDGRLVSQASLDFMRAWRQAGSSSTFFVGHGLFRQQLSGQWLVGHTGGVLGSTACAFWIEEKTTVFSVLSNIGTQEIGVRKPNALSVGLDPEFVRLASALSVDQKRSAPE